MDVQIGPRTEMTEDRSDQDVDVDVDGVYERRPRPLCPVMLNYAGEAGDGR